MRLPLAFGSAALIALMVTADPHSSLAGGLVSGATGSVSGAVGGVSAGVGASVGSGGVSAGAGVSVSSGISATIGATGTLSAAVKAELAGDIRLRARALGPKRLLALCLSVGAHGCAGASRARQLALIDARLKLLSGKRLARLCVSVGSSCGGASGNGSAGGIPGAGSGGGVIADAGSNSGAQARRSAGGDAEMKLTCRKVLRSADRYEAGLVKLCHELRD